MTVKVRNTSPHALPAYESMHAAGMDVRAHLPAPVALAPGDYTRIPTGLYLEIPEGYEMQVRPRSGLAAKHGVTVLNAPGTIDADYRGEVQVILINHGKEPFVIEDGMRVAQLLLAPVTYIEWERADELAGSGRGDGGFGHTGI